MYPSRRAFAMIELAMLVVMGALLAILMIPVMKQRWNADGLSTSLYNVRQIMAACDQYRSDHDSRTPMRGSGYSAGFITIGWDTWNHMGKNCSAYWAGSLDDHAYWRFLNPYLTTSLPPVPAGWTNSGSGSSWNFQQGTLTATQRELFAVKVCRSPGDVATRQRNWPNPTPGISSYDDVGTSYHLNMKWWDQPGIPPPGGMTGRYNAGTESIRSIPGPRWNRLPIPSEFVWTHDQIGDVVANSLGGTFPGEFGGDNMSVLGFLDGRAAYLELTTGALTGPGYSFAAPWP